MKPHEGWKYCLHRVAEVLRQEFHRVYPFKSDSEVSPRTLSLRDSVYIFPVTTHIALIDMEGFKTDFGNNQRYWTLLHYDLTDSSGHVEFEGIVKADDIPAKRSFFLEKFKISDHVFESLCELRLSGARGDGFTELVDLEVYDLRGREEEYGQLFLHSQIFEEAREILVRFNRQPDFNLLYGLTKMSIADEITFFEPDSRSQSFVRLDTGNPLSIEDWQAGIADLLLLPHAPEAVHTTFNRARRMYELAYLEYDLFTTAEHYAFLALEAAVNCFWISKLGHPVNVELRRGGQVLDSHLSLKSTRHELQEEIFSRGWGHKTVFVNGKEFCKSQPRVLVQLCEEGHIGAWQEKELLWAQQMRNHLTHLEHAPTLGPATDALRFACYHINLLFDDGRAKQLMLR